MQKITTPNGETLVVLPLAEYEKLVDSADIAAADKVIADIAAGIDEMAPSDVAERLINGENPVRVWRRHRGHTARELAQSAGVSAAYLSEIETGKKTGAVATMKAIAEALQVDLDDIT